MAKKRRGISISSCSLGCLLHHQFPLRMSLGRLGGEKVELILAEVGWGGGGVSIET